MADTKITALTALTSPALDDVLPLADLSDTTMDASGTTKKVKFGNIGNRIVLDYIDNLSTAGEFNFATIPTGYNFKNLYVRLRVRGDKSAILDALKIFFNADTAAGHYHSQSMYAADSAYDDPELSSSQIGVCSADNSPVGSYAVVEIAIPDYEDTNYLKHAITDFSAYYDTDAAAKGQSVVTWDYPTPITQIQIRSDGHSTDKLFGEAWLLGGN